jgi:hypothetical protein
MDWNDAVENDGQEFTLLPAGEYPFRVAKFERARYKGSDKIPPCNEAKLTLDVGDAEKSTTTAVRLFLVKSQEWKLASFFRSIGARKHGERMVMDWNKVIGATGTCKVKVRKWTGTGDNAGKEYEGNEVDKFLDPVEQPAETVGAAPSDW